MSRLGLALALVLWVSGALSPVRAQDHLQPEFAPLFDDVFGDYHHALREQLLMTDEERYVAAVEVPAFWPEWALLLGSADAGRGRLEVRRAKASIWYRLQEEEQHASIWQRLLKWNEPSGFTSYETTVGPFTARAVASAWESALRETRYPPPSDAVCLDSSIYHFSLGGQLTGSVDCFAPCSRISHLVGLLYRLRRFAVLPEATRPPEQEIIDYAQMLVDPAKLESRIVECKAEQTAKPDVDSKVRRISRHLEELAEWQYCSCGRWPGSEVDLRFFEDLDAAEARRHGVLDARPDYSDFARAKLSPQSDGSLRIAIDGHESVSEVPECFYPPRVRECPR